VTTLSAKGTKLNKRGLETRLAVLTVAVRCLADGGPEAVSANRIAREAGVTWGTVQHQFGDSDGLWAAVLESLSERGSALLPIPEDITTLEERVATIVDLIWDALDKPSMRAMQNLRLVLPRRHQELEAEYPRTAAALAAWDRKWDRACREAFRGMNLDPIKLRRVHSMLPGAVRGLHSEQYMSAFRDMDDARHGLAQALTTYLA
jgi:AcrR family transcriptional regulator